MTILESIISVIDHLSKVSVSGKENVGHMAASFGLLEATADAVRTAQAAAQVQPPAAPEESEE